MGNSYGNCGGYPHYMNALSRSLGILENNEANRVLLFDFLGSLENDKANGERLLNFLNVEEEKWCAARITGNDIELYIENVIPLYLDDFNKESYSVSTESKRELLFQRTPITLPLLNEEYPLQHFIETIKTAEVFNAKQQMLVSFLSTEKRTLCAVIKDKKELKFVGMLYLFKLEQNLLCRTWRIKTFGRQLDIPM